MGFTPPSDWESLKGFLSNREADALFASAAAAARHGPVLEVGSYCGKSTVVLAQALGDGDSVVFALDHHRGSEEHQPGELFFDPDLYDEAHGVVDSFRVFRHTIDGAGMADRVIPIVASSQRVATHWTTPLSMVFIDGGHSLDAALSDYRCWSGHLRRGGTLAIHDVFPDASRGGQAPYAIYRMALDSGLFEETGRVDSLALLKKL